MEAPIIKSLMQHGTNLNGNDILDLYTDTPFGNMTLKWFDIVQRIDCLNDTIVSLYKNFALRNDIRVNQANFGILVDPKLSYVQTYQTEEIIYWLRKTTDEFIGLLYLSDYKKTYNKYPSKIKISSIAEYLHSSQSFDNILDPHITFLENLNNVSNAYKHSFINHEVLNYHGENEPLAIALRLDYNRLENGHQFYTLALRSILNEFDLMIGKLKQKLASEFVYR